MWGFRSVCWVLGWRWKRPFCPLIGFASLFAGVPAVGGPGEQAPPEREGLAAGRALCSIKCTDSSRAGRPPEAPFLGLCAQAGTSGPGIQLWPHKPNCMCSNLPERYGANPPAPPRRSALTLGMRSELRDDSLWGSNGPRVQLLSPLVQSPCAPRPWIPGYSGMTGGMAGEGWE